MIYMDALAVDMDKRDEQNKCEELPLRFNVDISLGLLMGLFLLEHVSENLCHRLWKWRCVRCLVRNIYFIYTVWVETDAYTRNNTYSTISKNLNYERNAWKRTTFSYVVHKTMHYNFAVQTRLYIFRCLHSWLKPSRLHKWIPFEIDYDLTWHLLTIVFVIIFAIYVVFAPE